MKFELPYRRRSEVLRALMITALAIIVMGIILFPVYYVFTVSLKPQGTIASAKLDLVPDHVTFENYKEVIFGHVEATVKAKSFNMTAKSGKLFGTGYAIEYTNGVLWGRSYTDSKFNMKYVSDLRVEGGNKTVKNGQTVYVKGEKVSLKAKEIDASAGILAKELNLKAESVTLTLEDPKKSPIPLDGFEKVGNNTYVGYNVAIRLKGRVRLNSESGRFEAENFYYVIVSQVGGGFFGYLKRSLIIATLTVFLTLLLVIPAAYAFSRLKFFGREHVLYFYLMFTQVSGGLGIAGLVALYGMLVKLGLTDNIYVLPLIYAAGGVPFNTWLLKSYIDSISTDFDEAALVDGASYLQIIRYVLMPMALPGIATVAIFSFIGGWTELILANLLLSERNYPLTVWLFSMLNDLRNVSWNQFSAAALLFALPVFIMFLLAQNYIRSGLTVGGLKE